MPERRLSRVAMIVVLVLGALYLVAAWPGLSSVPARGDAWDRILESREVVVVVRTAIFVGAFYLIGSFLALAVEGRWFVRAGPTGAEVDPLADAQTFDDEAWGAIEEMESRLVKVEELARRGNSAVEGLRESLDELQTNVDWIIAVTEDGAGEVVEALEEAGS